MDVLILRNDLLFIWTLNSTQYLVFYLATLVRAVLWNVVKWDDLGKEHSRERGYQGQRLWKGNRHVPGRKAGRIGVAGAELSDGGSAGIPWGQILEGYYSKSCRFWAGRSCVLDIPGCVDRRMRSWRNHCKSETWISCSPLCWRCLHGQLLPFSES